MAECSKIQQFKIKKEIFDQAASRLACSDCKAVPKDVPIFQTGQGDVLCSICQPKSKLTGIFRSFVLEDLLKSLPISCKYQKNECPVVLQVREHLSYHEEDCEFRDVLCSYQFCEERISANEFKKHCLKEHEFDLENQTHNQNEIEIEVKHITEMSVLLKIKDEISNRYFVINPKRREDWRGCKAYFYNNSKSFLIHMRVTNAGYLLIWLQLVGSQFEARNFEYSLKVEDPDIGKLSYEGTVRSLDDDKNNIYETGSGLSIPHGTLKKMLQDEHFYFEVKIKDLKAELNKDEDSQIPMSDKEDD